jgi:spermidine/putrescine transport system substrate-binding protein
VQLQADNPDIKFVKPETGVMIWADAIIIPPLAQHKKNAEKLIDFYYDPKVAAQLTAYVQYICPVKGAQAEMEKIDPTLVDNKLIFPDEAFLADTHTFMSLSAEQEKAYAGQYQTVMGA